MSAAIDPARYLPEAPSDLDLKLKEIRKRRGLAEPLVWDAQADIKHLDGVPWHMAPKPFRFHRCWAQTDGWIGLTQVQRCACGAIRGNGSRHWAERNSR